MAIRIVYGSSFLAEFGVELRPASSPLMRSGGHDDPGIEITPETFPGLHLGRSGTDPSELRLVQMLVEDVLTVTLTGDFPERLSSDATETEIEAWYEAARDTAVASAHVEMVGFFSIGFVPYRLDFLGDMPRAGDVPDLTFDAILAEDNVVRLTPSDDTAFTGAGGDLVRGGAGDDSLDGGPDDDTLLGGAGADTLVGSFGDDLLRGRAGDDALYGDVAPIPDGSAAPLILIVGNDTLFGGMGDDLLAGGAGNDALRGSSGNDTLVGSFDMSDPLAAEPGARVDDRLRGGTGDDLLYADYGRDVLMGGTGADTFVLAVAETRSEVQRHVVRDFDLAEGDQLRILSDLSVPSEDVADFIADHVRYRVGAERLVIAAEGQRSVVLGLAAEDVDAILADLDWAAL